MPVEIHAWNSKSDQEPMAWELIDLKSEPTIVNLLSAHGLKLYMNIYKYIYIHIHAYTFISMSMD